MNVRWRESERPAGDEAGLPRRRAARSTPSINQAMARHFFGGENAVGKTFVQQGTGQRFNVIGVTHDAKYANLRDPAPLTYYLYHFQQPRRIADDAPVSRERRDRPTTRQRFSGSCARSRRRRR